MSNAAQWQRQSHKLLVVVQIVSQIGIGDFGELLPRLPVDISGCCGIQCLTDVRNDVIWVF